jgi:hypothetical protein
MKKILGKSAHFHNAAATIWIDGTITDATHCQQTFQPG